MVKCKGRHDIPLSGVRYVGVVLNHNTSTKSKISKFNKI